jgi:hypothetical protein
MAQRIQRCDQHACTPLLCFAIPADAMAPPTSPTDSMLPPELLLQVLQLVPLPQRLYGCALVCKSWAAAAVAATTKISLSKDLPYSTPSTISDSDSEDS